MSTASPTRRLTVTWPDPAPGVDHARRSAGLDHLLAVSSGAAPGPPVMALVGARLDEVGMGRSVVLMEIGEQHQNIAGTVHGGMIATLLDLALGAAVHTMLEAGQGYTTIDLSIQMVRAIASAGTLRCEADLTHRGRRTATASATVRDDRGRDCAFATASCLILGRPHAADTADDRPHPPRA